MSTILEIDDGNPTWLSPDIWVVPGSDPTATPGTPIAGSPAFVWARTHNNGREPVSGARVNFYWSNPALGVLRSNSTPIGSAFVDLEAGETADVLCLVPWVPVVVNGGHECLVAEIVHGSDPLPSPLPDAFDPPGARQVAQRNLNILPAGTTMRSLLIQVAAAKRRPRQLKIMLEPAEKGVDERLLATVGLKGYRVGRPGAVRAYLSARDDPNDNRDAKDTALSVELAAGTACAVFLHVQAPDLERGTYVVFHVQASEHGQLTGGLSALVIRSEEK